MTGWFGIDNIDDVALEWERQLDTYKTFVRPIPLETQGWPPQGWPPQVASVPPNNMVVKIQNEQALDFVFYLIDCIIHKRNLMGHSCSLVNTNSLPNILDYCPNGNSLLYLRGSRSLFYPLASTGEEIVKNDQLFSATPIDIRCFNKALSRITLNNQLSDVNTVNVLHSCSEKGLLSYPQGNPHFLYILLPDCYRFQGYQENGIHHPQSNSLLCLYYYCCKNVSDCCKIIGFFPDYLVLDHFSILENGANEINRIVEDVQKLNKIGVSVIIITRNDHLKTGDFYEKVFPSYLDIAPYIFRGKRRVNVHQVRWPNEHIDYLKKWVFSMENDAWQKCQGKFESLYPKISEAFNVFGMTAVEIQDYLKQYYHMEISLASLSKLLLKLGLRRNKFHKRKKTRKKR